MHTLRSRDALGGLGLIRGEFADVATTLREEILVRRTPSALD